MSKMPSIAVIAGGLATRMKPLTEKIPKSMLDVAGEPFIAHQLRLFAREKIKHVVLCVGYLGEMIRDFIGNGSRFGLEVAYSFDGSQLLGTGGALRKALPLLGHEFLVTYGDSYLDIPYAPIVDFFHKSDAVALMTVFHNVGQWDTSNIDFFNGRIVDYSKRPTARMTYIDYGLSMVRAKAFDECPPGEVFDLATLYHRLVRQQHMVGVEVFKRFYEIGSQSGLAQLDLYLRAAHVSRV